jgi:hypothetical protein
LKIEAELPIVIWNEGWTRGSRVHFIFNGLQRLPEHAHVTPSLVLAMYIESDRGDRIKWLKYTRGISEHHAPKSGVEAGFADCSTWGRFDCAWA